MKYIVNGTYVGTFDLNAVTAAQAGGSALNIHTNAGDCGSTNNRVSSNVPAVIRTTAKTDYTQPPGASADEIENDTDDTCFVDRDYSTIPNNEFDDQLIWISPNVLFNRMISAGKLP